MDSQEMRRRWAERSGEFSPEYYAHYGSDARSSRIAAILEREVGRDAAVLELGCSSGRHLAHLHDSGFDDLAGIEVNADAADAMAATFPALADAVTLHIDAIEDVVEGFPDDRFDATFSVETLQHLHPDLDWVFEEVARITDGVVITAENEGGSPGSGPRHGGLRYVEENVPIYHRDWGSVLEDAGVEQIAAVDDGRVTVRTFRSGPQ